MMHKSKENSVSDEVKQSVSSPTVTDETVVLHQSAGEAQGDDKTKARSNPAVTTQTGMPKSIGRYAARDILGRGAFGAVYLGHDGQLDRDVAIKVPVTEDAVSSDSETIDSFLQEARQLANLTHPNIVTVFDVGVDNGLCYIVSDYLKGPDLDRWLCDRTPSWQESAQIVAEVADGLALAHAQSTVHRDIKPANIIMTQRAEGVVPIVVDFGLALSEKTTSQMGPARGEVTGTPSFMSPEQARGEGHRIDGRTDIYSLGVVLYRLLAGRVPFRAPTFGELLRMVVQDEPCPPRQIVHGIPRELERICLKAMAKAINDRYTTAGDMAADLRQLLCQNEAEVKAAQAALKAQRQPLARKPTKILIADDHPLSRFKLENDLKKWGHHVTVAEDGQQAWEFFQQDEFSIVITDWMMPKVDGLELVRRIRAAQQADYVYVIMLTAKAEKHDIITGMGAGADDFLTKPFQRDELQVRLRAGLRITKLNRELNETNRRLQRNLDAAGQVQRSFLPTTALEIPEVRFAWDHRSSEKLGGDVLNFVQLDERHLALFVLDVSGERVPATLLATQLSRAMAPASDAQSLLVERSDAGTRILEPVEVAQRLNKQFSGGEQGSQFFTMAYGVLNLDSRSFCFTSAGHPPLLLKRANDSPVMLDISGFPIGMAPEDEVFSQQSVVLEPNDRLLMYSDGLPDTLNQEGDVFGAARLLDLASRLHRLPLDEAVRSLMDELDRFRGDAAINDDVSLLAVEVTGG